LRDNVLFSSPKDEVEHAYVAGACVLKLGIKFPALVDGFGNQKQAGPLRLSPGRSGTGHQNIASG
jgi:hypothetical protein